MSADSHAGTESSQTINAPRITPQDFDPAVPNSVGFRSAEARARADQEPTTENADAPPLRRQPRKRNWLRDRAGRVADMEQLLPRKVPRLRDIQIYESVVFEKMSQHDVAAIFGLSQPRVCQIVAEVRTWKATVPWEVAGMTDEQQINLATHETRQWLSVIRDKALEKADLTEGASHRMVYDKSGQQVHSESNRRSIPPKPGFLAIALQAVLKAGQLGGAGEQWKRPKSAEREAPGGGEFKVQSSTFKVDGSQRETLNVEPGTLNSANARLLKKNPPAFTAENGKANGHAVSALSKAAQLQGLRRGKNRRIAYQAAADRQGLSPDARRNFFAMLRQLEQAAGRVERMVQIQLKRDARQGAQPTGEALQEEIESARRRGLERQLQLDRRLRTHPYGNDWVWQQYDVSRGRFRWQEEQ
jgi:predicted transcriptional regulator